jgi:transmembrane 9 superfamily member 2/4
MRRNATCKLICSTTIPGVDLDDGIYHRAVDSDGYFINQRIFEGYLVNWLIDGLPAATVKYDPRTTEKFYSVGFELGSVDNAGTPLLHNHFEIVVEYHVPPIFSHLIDL